MAVSFDKMDFNLVLKDLGKLCLTTSVCKECKKEKCLIGYSKEAIIKCIKNNITYVEDGMKNLPISDIKSYNEEDLIVGIADILHLCASCKEDHFEDCIVNVIRSSYELELFGDIQPYKGSAVGYIIDLNHAEYKKGIASRIVEQYHKVDYLESKKNG